MKKNLTIAIFGLFTLALVSFTLAKPECLSKSVSPPGTIQVSENYFVDQTEVTNFSWIEYLYWLKRKHGNESPIYRAALPDTTVWGDTANPYTKSYLRSPVYRNYPVVGISYLQANAYCNWRSDRVNEYFYLKDNKKAKIDSTTVVPQRFTYRLPTEEEWNALNSFDKPKKKDLLPNLYQKDKQVHTTFPAYAGTKNKFGLLHVIGNVAEMTTTPNHAKGGSWKHTASESNYKLYQTYSAPSNWLGFRCVCDVKPI